ncbi:MAG: hypothetical protein LUG98_11385, partial [Tannerellaceae bacterium]|nr:hypothetical protein [Tannerellaceae bacterium]
VNYISEFTIYINGEIIPENLIINQNIYFTQGKKAIPIETIRTIAQQLAFNRLSLIHISGSNIFEYTDLLWLLNAFDKLNAVKKLYVRPEQYIENSDFFHNNKSEQLKGVLLFNKNYSLVQAISEKAQNDQMQFLFYVHSVEDCEIVENLIRKFNLADYDVKPVYNGVNDSFFHNFIFPDEDDIRSIHLSKREVFANQFLNTNDFGKLILLPTGDVYANLNHPVLGNLNQLKIADIISKEILEGKSWLQTRDGEPCASCLNQWLCPSPSGIEYILGKMNVCKCSTSL